MNGRTDPQSLCQGLERRSLRTVARDQEFDIWNRSPNTRRGLQKDVKSLSLDQPAGIPDERDVARQAKCPSGLSPRRALDLIGQWKRISHGMSDRFQVRPQGFRLRPNKVRRERNGVEA